MKISLIIFLLSVFSFGQSKITWLDISYSSFKLYSSTSISIETPESNFYTVNKSKNDKKPIVTIKMNLKDDRDYKKTMYLSSEDYKEIETKLLELNSKDIFHNISCLDGYHLVLKIGDNNSHTTFDISCLKNKDTNIHQVINIILDKLKIKKEDFYR